MGSITARYDVNTKICSISRTAFSEYLSDRGASISSVRRELELLPPRSAILSSTKRKVLTSGLKTCSSAAVYAWEIDLKHPSFGNVAMELVQSLNDEYELSKKGA